MNEGFTPNRPPDEEPDPLLEALRQRLGAGYGQKPSPELWAGIRQRLPAAAPRPWWLRAHRLLPLLAGLLLVSLVLVRQAERSPLAHQPAPTKNLPARPALSTASAHIASPTRVPAAASVLLPSWPAGQARLAPPLLPAPCCRALLL